MAKKPENLDDEYGPAPDWSRLDPTHLHAIGVRIQNLADEIRNLRIEGSRRDDKIDSLKRTADVVATELSDLVHRRMTDDDMVTLRKLIQSYERRTWLWERTLKYVTAAGATITFFWLFRDPIGAAMHFIFGSR